jgi:hypothetical protein
MKPLRIVRLIVTFGMSLIFIGASLARAERIALVPLIGEPLGLTQQQAPQPATCDELQVVFIIDQSGSMFGFTNTAGDFVPPTDPTGLRYFAPEEAVDLLGSLRWQAYPDATIQVAMIYFGDQPRTAMPWQQINPTSKSEYEQLLQDLAVYFAPLDHSLGNTLFLGPVQSASSLFSQVRSQVDGCPTRLVVLVTDGLPADGTRGFNWQNHLREVAEYVQQFMPPPDHRIYVIGVDEAGAFFAGAASEWADVTGHPDRVLLARSQAEMASLLARIVNEAAATLVGRGTVRGCVAEGGRMVVPPYLQELRVTLFKATPNLHLEIRDAGGRVLTDALPGVTVLGFDEPIESVVVSNPQPGVWQVLTELPPGSADQCLVNFIGIIAREQVIMPHPGATMVQFQESLVAFQLVDSNGDPLPDYNNPDYDLQMNVELIFATGEEQILTLGANPGQEYRGVVIPEYMGPVSLQVNAISRDDDNGQHTIFNKSIVDFEVQPIRFVLLEGPDAGAPIGQYSEIPLSFAVVVTGQQPVELALPTIISATLLHESSNEKTSLSFSRNGGAYQTIFRADEAGAYTLVYEAAVNTSRGINVIEQSQLHLNVFPVMLMRAEFVPPFEGIATDPLLRPTGIELRLQFVDENGQITSPSAVGVRNPDELFQLTVRDEKGETLLQGTQVLLRTGQPGVYRLRENELGAGKYTIFVESATDLAQGYDWEDVSWTVEVVGQVNPLFYSLLAVTLLLATAVVLGAVSQIKVRRHPLSGVIQIYEEQADPINPEEGAIKKTLFSTNLPRRNRVTYRPNLRQGGCQNITKLKVTSPNEQAAVDRTATVEIRYRGKKSSKVILSPGSPVTIGPGCYLVKDPQVGARFDSDITLKDEF